MHGPCVPPILQVGLLGPTCVASSGRIPPPAAFSTPDPKAWIDCLFPSPISRPILLFFPSSSLSRRQQNKKKLSRPSSFQYRIIDPGSRLRVERGSKPDLGLTSVCLFDGRAVISSESLRAALGEKFPQPTPPNFLTSQPPHIDPIEASPLHQRAQHLANPPFRNVSINHPPCLCIPPTAGWVVFPPATALRASTSFLIRSAPSSRARCDPARRLSIRVRPIYLRFRPSRPRRPKPTGIDWRKWAVPTNCRNSPSPSAGDEPCAR